jgi:hypothetical protein
MSSRSSRRRQAEHLARPGSGNDIVYGRVAADVVSDLDAIFRTFRLSGIRPVATTVLPHGHTPADRLVEVAAVNNALLSSADVLVSD